MTWNEISDYTIIENKPLTRLAKEYNTKLISNNKLKKTTRDWFNFARVMSAKYKFNVIYEACFVYYVTLYLADEGISVGVEDEYFIQRLDKKVDELYMKSLDEKVNETEQKVYFYTSLVNLFGSGEIRQYERKVFHHQILVSAKIKEWFGNFDTVGGTIRGLMYNKIEKPYLNMNEETSASIAFILTYSEETVWRSLSNISDGDRLRVLLY